MNIKDMTHSIHSYHAKYIPEIPKYFLDKYSKKGDTIFDPFCGSGTTMLEAMISERNSVGVDISFIAYKISKAKTTVVTQEQLEETFSKFKTDYNNMNSPKNRVFPDKYVWYTKSNADTLDKILSTIDKIEDENIKNIYETAFSSILKRVSNKRKTWNNGYIADNVLPNTNFDGDVYRIFTNKIKEYHKKYNELNKALENKKPTTAKVYNKNILDYKTDIKFDAVITSPPYPFAVDFVKYNRLTYYWFNENVLEFCEKETGSRHKRNRKNSLNDFFEEMEEIYLHIFKFVKKGGYFCMTVGNTKQNKKEIMFYEWLENIFLKNGWRIIENKKRKLKNQSMAQKRIKEEYVVVFQKI